MASPTALFARAREERPLLDHLVRTVQRYQADAGDSLAAAVTYYWFLSLFPIVLLAIALLGFVYGDDASTKVETALTGVLPGTVAQTLGDTLEKAAGPAGVLGILGVLYSGLGWIDGLRQAIRTIWHQNVLVGNIVVSKLVDVVVLVGLFATIGASVFITGTAASFTGSVLSFLQVDDTLAARLFTRLLGVGLALVADVALFLYLFARLSKVKNPLKRLLKGAVFGAVGFEVLKIVGGVYVARTTSKGAATYGTFAVVVGLLLFLNLVSRLLLLASAFVVTAPYDSDVAPSGTASREQARRAGIPEEFAGADPEDPPNLVEEGAPSRLAAAVQGKTPSQDEPGDGDRRSASLRAATGAGAVPADDSRSRPLPSEDAVRTAARITSGAVAVVLGGVAVHALGTARRLLQRRRGD